MSDETISIISVGERERWEAEHAQGGLPSQSWGYAYALAASGLDPKLGVVHAARSRMLLPFIERTWSGRVDIATTVGLSGASISPSSVAPLSVWRKYAVERGWIAGYIRLATSVELDEALPTLAPVPNRTVFLLDLARDNLLRSTSEIVRRKIRRAVRSGVIAVDDRRVLADNLKSLYPETMHRVGAGLQYDFSAETIERWVFDPSSVVLGASLGGSVEAVSIFCVAGSHAEYHVNGCTPQGRELAAWLIWEGIVRLCDRGVRVLNLGGAGARPNDGVYRFKERFNGVPKSVYAARQIYDRPTYDGLCRLAGTTSGGEWFPGYRAPKSSGAGPRT